MCWAGGMPRVAWELCTQDSSRPTALRITILLFIYNLYNKIVIISTVLFCILCHSDTFLNLKGDCGNLRICSQVGQKCRQHVDPEFVAPMGNESSHAGLGPLTCGVFTHPDSCGTALICRAPSQCQRPCRAVA